MNSLNNASGLLIMLTGLPGVGKSTLAKKIEQALDNYSVCSVQSDAVRKRLYPNPTYSAEESKHAHETVHQLVLDNLLVHDVVIYDATNMLQLYRDWGKIAVEQTGAQLLVVAAVADEATVRRRLAARQHDPTQLSDADYTIYKLLADSAEPIAGDHIVVRCEDEYEADFEQLIQHLRTMLTSR